MSSSMTEVMLVLGRVLELLTEHSCATHDLSSLPPLRTYASFSILYLRHPSPRVCLLYGRGPARTSHLGVKETWARIA